MLRFVGPSEIRTCKTVFAEDRDNSRVHKDGVSSRAIYKIDIGAFILRGAARTPRMCDKRCESCERSLSDRDVSLLWLR